MRNRPVRSLVFVVAVLVIALVSQSQVESAQTAACCQVEESPGFKLRAGVLGERLRMLDDQSQPSSPTGTELEYLASTELFRNRLGAFQEALEADLRSAVAGQIDSIALTDLAALTRDLFAARQVFASAVPSVRLDQYDRTVKLALDRAYTATSLLVRAQASASPEEQATLIREAGLFNASSGRLLKEASDELRAVLPGAVSSMSEGG